MVIGILLRKNKSLHLSRHERITREGIKTPCENLAGVTAPCLKIYRAYILSQHGENVKRILGSIQIRLKFRETDSKIRCIFKKIINSVAIILHIRKKWYIIKR